jgi:fructose/tagatose bisphosphate aldolase
LLTTICAPIACGTAKINVNTENMYAWCEAVKALFAADTGHDINDPAKLSARLAARTRWLPADPAI